MKFVELEAECPLVAEQWKGSIAFPRDLLKVSCRTHGAEASGKERGWRRGMWAPEVEVRVECCR